MPTSFGYRDDHLLTFFQYAEIMNLDPKQLFGLSLTNCATNVQSTGCGVSWTEYAWQLVNHPSRMSLAVNIAEAEQRISNWLGTSIGPKYHQNEKHVLAHPIGPRKARAPTFGRHWGINDGPVFEVKTRYRNVIAGGGRTLTLLEPATEIRTFIDERGWGFTDSIQFTYTGLVLEGEPELMLFQSGIDPSHLGHRLRPFNSEYNPATETLVITLPKVIAVDLNEYSSLPQTGQNYIKDLDFCDEDIFIESLDLYLVTRDNCPAGTIQMRQVSCSCTSGCERCQMVEVPACLRPGDPVSGYMEVVPVPGDPLFESLDLGCYSGVPVSVCFDYVTSPCHCWGEQGVIEDTVCPEFAPAIAWLASGLMPEICDCGCLDALFGYYQRDLQAHSANARSRIINYDDFQFGTTQGALSAYESLKYITNIIGNKHWFVG